MLELETEQQRGFRDALRCSPYSSVLPVLGVLTVLKVEGLEGEGAREVRLPRRCAIARP